MKEIWKDIKGYEGIYQISNLGRLKSNIKRNRFGKKTIRILEKWKFKNHYPFVRLVKDKQKTKYYVHRLVAEAFIENPKGYKYVNHIDGNKSNPKASNLEWCNQKYNALHAKYILKIKTPYTSRPVIRSDGKIFLSIKEASKETGCSTGFICDTISGRKKTAKGFKFAYIDESNETVKKQMYEFALKNL